MFQDEDGEYITFVTRTPENTKGHRDTLSN